MVREYGGYWQTSYDKSTTLPTGEPKLSLKETSYWTGERFDVRARIGTATYTMSYTIDAIKAQRGDIVSITAKITNIGDGSGKAQLWIKLNEEWRAQSVQKMLRPGEAAYFTAVFTLNQSGRIKVDLHAVLVTDDAVSPLKSHDSITAFYLQVAEPSPPSETQAPSQTTTDDTTKDVQKDRAEKSQGDAKESAIQQIFQSITGGDVLIAAAIVAGVFLLSRR
jgi:hypothetical protein